LNLKAKKNRQPLKCQKGTRGIESKEAGHRWGATGTGREQRRKVAENLGECGGGGTGEERAALGKLINPKESKRRTIQRKTKTKASLAARGE